MQNNQYTSNISPDDIERRLPNASGASNNGGVQFSEDNYLNTRLAKGEQQRVMNIRILPIDDKLCVEIMTHGLKVPYDVAKSGFKSFMCLNDKRNPNYDPNVKCPLCAKGDELYQASLAAKQRGDEALSKSLLEQAKPFFRKNTYIFRVIDRNKEAQGVKFWRFNGRSDKKDPYNSLLSLYEINKAEALKFQGIQGYNIFDLGQGRDINLTLTLDKKGTREYTAVSVSVSSYMTPLSPNPQVAEAWLRDSKRWTDVYTHKPAEYLQIISEGLVPKFNQDTNRYEGVAPKMQQAPLTQAIPEQQANMGAAPQPQQYQPYQQPAPMPQQQPAPQQPVQQQQQGYYAPQGQPYQQPAPAPTPQQQYPPQGYQQQPMAPSYGPAPQPMNGNGYPPVGG